jgi:hypothetical protein
LCDLALAAEDKTAFPDTFTITLTTNHFAPPHTAASMDDSASEHSVDGDNLSNDAYLAKLFSRGSRLGTRVAKLQSVFCVSPH